LQTVVDDYMIYNCVWKITEWPFPFSSRDAAWAV
jgi:hypothetical protein